MKLHPITGEPVPDPEARLEVYRYLNAEPAKWPEADFIVGNPPFIGGKDLRAELGDGYAEALWASRGKRSGSIDFVMYWWDQAATILRVKGARLRRFGFITTNSITQKFSRRVLETHLKASKDRASLVFAVPDHPWVNTGKGMGKKAAVRIAMTVAEKGERIGKLAEVVAESGLDTDQPVIHLSARTGRLNPDLSLGVDLTGMPELRASEGLSGRGVQLMGDGFIVTPAQARRLGLGRIAGLERHIKPYLHNRDLKSRPRGVLVIDLFGLEENEVRFRYPELFQFVLDRVKPERDVNARASYREYWWVFGEPRALLRPAISELGRIIATGETSQHRFFEFFPTSTIADNMIRVVALDDGYHLGVLSSHAHTVFSVQKGGWMGVGNDPRYQAECFSTFPFPAATEAQKAVIRALAEELDALRKTVIAQHDFLTMTRLYNVRERLKAIAAWRDGSPLPGGARSDRAGDPGEGGASSGLSPLTPSLSPAGRGGPAAPGITGPPPLTDSEKAIHDAGCVGVIHELHERIDAAVAEAYGWGADPVSSPGQAPGSSPGQAPVSSPGQAPGSGQAISDEQILERLVALNTERAEEERSGLVRWLRPDYQASRFGAARSARKPEQVEADLIQPAEQAPPLPRDDAELVAALRRRLRAIGRPALPAEIARRFREGGRGVRRVEHGLKLLAGAGVARKDMAGWYVPGERA